MNARRALLVCVVSLPSCAATSGRAWLEAPLDPQAASSAAMATDWAAHEEPTEARPRLRHTVTLGESYEVAGAARPVGSPQLQVNITNQIINHPNGYAGYGYGYAGYGFGYAGYARSGTNWRGSGAPVRATPSVPQKVGGDFPAPPDYGPRAFR
jgi:hypothetical protein